MTKCSPGPKWQKSTVFSYAGGVLEGLAKKMLPLIRLNFQNFCHVPLPKECGCLKNLKMSSLDNKQAKSFEDLSILPDFLLWLVYRDPKARSSGACFYTQNMFFVLSSQNTAIPCVALQFLICEACICRSRQCVCKANEEKDWPDICFTLNI